MTTPLVPPHVDLRRLPWMRLDTGRLLDSDMFALSTGDEFKAAVALWCKSWSQMPAASLPDDDRVLAHLSGAGTRWKKLRPMALRGWIKCDDGRLYHPVVAEQALAAWDERQAYQEREESRLTREERYRKEHKELRQQLRDMGITMPWNAKIEELRERLAATTKSVTGYDTYDAPTTHPRCANDAPPTAKTGRDGTGDINPKSERETRAPAGTPEDSQLPDGVDPERWASYRDQLADDGKLSISRIKTALLQLRRVIAAGHDANDVLTAAVMRGLRDLDDVAARLARERGTAPPNARGGPRQPNGQQPLGKTAQALHALEAMKHGTELDQAGNPHGLPEAPHARIGSNPRR